MSQDPRRYSRPQTSVSNGYQQPPPGYPDPYAGSSSNAGSAGGFGAPPMGGMSGTVDGGNGYLQQGRYPTSDGGQSFQPSPYGSQGYANGSGMQSQAAGADPRYPPLAQQFEQYPNRNPATSSLMTTAPLPPPSSFQSAPPPQFKVEAPTNGSSPGLLPAQENGKMQSRVGLRARPLFCVVCANNQVGSDVWSIVNSACRTNLRCDALGCSESIYGSS